MLILFLFSVWCVFSSLLSFFFHRIIVFPLRSSHFVLFAVLMEHIESIVACAQWKCCWHHVRRSYDWLPFAINWQMGRASPRSLSRCVTKANKKNAMPLTYVRYVGVFDMSSACKRVRPKSIKRLAEWCILAHDNIRHSDVRAEKGWNDEWDINAIAFNLESNTVCFSWYSQCHSCLLGCRWTSSARHGNAVPIVCSERARWTYETDWQIRGRMVRMQKEEIHETRPRTQ